MASARRFDPSEIWGDRLHLDKLERHEAKWTFVRAPCPSSGLCRCCGFHKPHKGGIVVAIDNAYQSDGRTNTKASYGVYFNISSTFNMAGLLGEGCMTNERAELSAAIESFRACLQILCDTKYSEKITQVVIKSCSAYLVSSMVIYVEEWRSNNFKDSRGRAIVNEDLLHSLDNLVLDLEKVGLEVRFWLVSCAQNQQANKLANAALEGVDYTQFTKEDLFGRDILGTR
jgi:ribonuclease HI